MASTITIQQTLNWALSFTVGRPNTGVLAIANEPGLTNANKILQTILAAPFRWAWNRKEVNFLVNNVGVADKVVALSDFGWLERAAYQSATNTLPTKELEIHEVLAIETRPNQPQRIAPILDDNAGNITFRLMPPPDGTYNIFLTYQKAPVLASSLGATTWAPIPDRYAFLYELAMMAHLQGMYSPQLYALNMEMFFRQLIGSAEGLTETERAIFLEDRLRTMRMEQQAILNTQQGRAARSLR